MSGIFFNLGERSILSLLPPCFGVSIALHYRKEASTIRHVAVESSQAMQSHPDGLDSQRFLLIEQPLR